MRGCFLTGATGVVGSTLVPELLRDPDVEVTLLVRAADDGALSERLRGLLAYWGYEAGDERASRITAVRGDATEARLGMDPHAYGQAVETCQTIVHAAGLVRMNLPLEEARRAAVGSAEQVLALADAMRAGGTLEKVELVSTVGVAGRRHGRFDEEWVTDHGDFHNTYEAAKADAEVLVRRRIEDGLPITVHRPSMVVGEAGTGKVIHFQVFYHLCEFLSGRRTFGVFPGVGEVRLDTVPSDYVARAIAWSSRRKETIGCRLHLCSGPRHAMRLTTLRRRIRAAFRAAGVEVPAPLTIPRPVFRAVLPAIGLLAPVHVKRALSTLPVFIEYLDERQVFGNARTEAILAPAGMETPKPENYIDVVLDRYLRERHATN